MTAIRHASILDKIAHDIVASGEVSLDSFSQDGLTTIVRFDGELVEMVRQSCLDPHTVSHADLHEVYRRHEYSLDYDSVLRRISNSFRSGRVELDQAVAAVIVQIYRLLEARDEYDRNYLGD